MEKPYDFDQIMNMEKLKLLIYVSKLVFPKFNSFSFPLFMFIQYFKIKQFERIYSLDKIDPEFIHELSLNSGEDLIDDNYSVVINNKYVKGNNFGSITVHFNNKLHRRYVNVLLSDEIPEGKAFISTSLMFNITDSSNRKDSEFDIQNLEVQMHRFSEAKISFAKEVELALINSPCDIDNSTIDALLENYFYKPKLLKESDVIEINAKYYLQSFLCNVAKSMNFSNFIYFKCTKLVPRKKCVKNCYFVVKGETKLKQVPNIQCFVPPKTGILLNFEFISEKCVNKLNSIPACPYGLENHASEIDAAIKPFLFKDCKMHPAFLLIGKKGSGRELLISSIASKFGMHFFKVTNFDVTANVYVQNETKLKNIFFNAKLCAPCIIYMKNFENFEKNNDGQSDERIISHFINGLNDLFDNNKYPVILFCATNIENISGELKRGFLEIFKINPLTEEERMKNLQWILKYEGIAHNCDIKELALKTNSFLFEDLRTLVRKAINFQNDEEILNESSFSEALDYMQLNYNESIGAPTVPRVLWEDVGGLSEVKDEIIKTINFPLKNPKFFETTGIGRFGILLFGPPGTGKTLLAKAVATECNLCFLSVKGPELLNMYIGQSEENIREVFARARAASPCIIFFDELDSLAPNRGVSGDSGGVMDRVVSQLLSEMDGVNEKATVFVIGATNRPDLIDPALLRPGRFDKLLYVGPAIDFNSRLSVLKALTRKFNFDEDVDLRKIIEICPENISGADFYGICSNSWSNAVRRLIQSCENGAVDADTLSAKDVKVNFDDFKIAFQSTKSSISEDDLKYFEKLRKEISSNV